MTPLPFDFDPAKEWKNQRKHGMSLVDGFRVLSESDPVTLMTWFDDREDYGEDRWNTLGSLPEKPGMLLHITWTESDEDRVRILSVRRATPAEKRRHAHRHDRSD